MDITPIYFCFKKDKNTQPVLELNHTKDINLDNVEFCFSEITGSEYCFGCLLIDSKHLQDKVRISLALPSKILYVDRNHPATFFNETIGVIGIKLVDPATIAKTQRVFPVSSGEIILTGGRFRDKPLLLQKHLEEQFEKFIEVEANYSIGKVPGKYYLRNDVDVFYKTIFTTLEKMKMTNKKESKPCVFCDIANYDTKGQVLKTYYALDHDLICDVVIIEPLNPVIAGGHFLAIPKIHICNTLDENKHTSTVYASTMKVAAMYAKSLNKPNNIITSTGSEAMQTVFHLHIHILTRCENDNLVLPWTNQNK